jgi:hypothetical protein
MLVGEFRSRIAEGKYFVATQGLWDDYNGGFVSVYFVDTLGVKKINDAEKWFQDARMASSDNLNPVDRCREKFEISHWLKGDFLGGEILDGTIPLEPLRGLTNSALDSLLALPTTVSEIPSPSGNFVNFWSLELGFAAAYKCRLGPGGVPIIELIDRIDNVGWVMD